MKNKGFTVSVKSENEDPQNVPRFKPRPAAVAAAGREIKDNPPAILKKTAKKSGKGRAKKQAVAIMLSKARKGL